MKHGNFSYGSNAQINLPNFDSDDSEDHSYDQDKIRRDDNDEKNNDNELQLQSQISKSSRSNQYQTNNRNSKIVSKSQFLSSQHDPRNSTPSLSLNSNDFERNLAQDQFQVQKSKPIAHRSTKELQKNKNTKFLRKKTRVIQQIALLDDKGRYHRASLYFYDAKYLRQHKHHFHGDWVQNLYLFQTGYKWDMLRHLLMWILVFLTIWQPATSEDFSFNTSKISWTGPTWRTVKAILQSIPYIIDVTLLITFMTVVYAVVGSQVLESAIQDESFEPDVEADFSSISDSVASLFTLITLSNYPGVMLPYIRLSSWYLLYFIPFVIIAVIIFLPIPVAVVYQAFRRNRGKILMNDQIHQRQCFFAAFCCLDSKKQGFITLKTWEQYFNHIFSGRHHKRNVVRLFRHCDNDNTGYLNVQNFFKACQIALYMNNLQKGCSFECKCWVRFRLFCNKTLKFDKLIKSCFFEIFIFLIIIANTVVLILSANSQDDDLISKLQNIDDIFTYIFLCQVIVKVIALGIHDYWKDNWNKFDFFLVFTSLLSDIIIAILKSQTTGSQTTSFRFVRLTKSQRALRVLRGLKSFRIFRILSKTASTFTRIKRVIHKTILCLPTIWKLIIVMTLLYFFYAIIGCQLYHTDQPIQLEGEFRQNYTGGFNNVPDALLSLFQVLCQAGWQFVMLLQIQNEGVWGPFIYFFTFHIFVIFVIKALISSLIWEVFLIVNQADQANDAIEQAKLKDQLQRNKNKDNDAYGDDDDYDDNDQTPYPAFNSKSPIERNKTRQEDLKDTFIMQFQEDMQEIDQKKKERAIKSLFLPSQESDISFPSNQYAKQKSNSQVNLSLKIIQHSKKASSRNVAADSLIQRSYNTGSNKYRTARFESFQKDERSLRNHTLPLPEEEVNACDETFGLQNLSSVQDRKQLHNAFLSTPRLKDDKFFTASFRLKSGDRNENSGDNDNQKSFKTSQNLSVVIRNLKQFSNQITYQQTKKDSQLKMGTIRRATQSRRKFTMEQSLPGIDEELKQSLNQISRNISQRNLSSQASSLPSIMRKSFVTSKAMTKQLQNFRLTPKDEKITQSVDTFSQNDVNPGGFIQSTKLIHSPLKSTGKNHHTLSRFSQRQTPLEENQIIGHQASSPQTIEKFPSNTPLSKNTIQGSPQQQLASKDSNSYSDLSALLKNSSKFALSNDGGSRVYRKSSRFIHNTSIITDEDQLFQSSEQDQQIQDQQEQNSQEQEQNKKEIQQNNNLLLKKALLRQQNIFKLQAEEIQYFKINYGEYYTKLQKISDGMRIAQRQELKPLDILSYQVNTAMMNTFRLFQQVEHNSLPQGLQKVMRDIEAICPYGSLMRIVYRFSSSNFQRPSSSSNGQKISKWILPYFKHIKYQRGVQFLLKKEASVTQLDNFIPLIIKSHLERKRQEQLLQNSQLEQSKQQNPKQLKQSEIFDFWNGQVQEALFDQNFFQSKQQSSQEQLNKVYKILKKCSKKMRQQFGRIKKTNYSWQLICMPVQNNQGNFQKKRLQVDRARFNCSASEYQARKKGWMVTDATIVLLVGQHKKKSISPIESQLKKNNSQKIQAAGPNKSFTTNDTNKLQKVGSKRGSLLELQKNSTINMDLNNTNNDHYSTTEGGMKLNVQTQQLMKLVKQMAGIINLNRQALYNSISLMIKKVIDQRKNCREKKSRKNFFLQGGKR